MSESEDRPQGRWLGLIALAWFLLLGACWLLLYGKLPLPRLASIGPLAKEFALLAWVLGGAYGWGRLALYRWHTPAGERPNPYFAFALGFGLLWLATFVVAALHLLGPAWPWLLLGGGWLALVATLRPLPKLRYPAVASWTAFQWFLLFVMASSLVYGLLGWALVPPVAWDEVSYHLPVAQRFLEAGGFVNLPTLVHSNWPSGMELLNALALSMGSERLPHLIVTALVVLTALGLAQFGRQRFGIRTAWLAAALYLSMPMVRFLSGVALVEGALGFFGFVAIWAGYVWLENRSWQDLVVAGALGGLTASIKLTGAAIPLAVGITGLAWLLIRYRNNARRNITQFLGYGLISLAVVAPWYIRSASNTGNPFWPFLYSVFGGQDWDAIGDRIHTTWLRRPNMPRTVWSYLTGPWQLAVDPGQFGGLIMGAAAFVLAPLSLLFWRSRGWLLGYLTAVVVLVYSIWFLTTHQTRFLMGIVPVLTLLAAYAFCELLVIWPTWLASMARVAMILYLVLGLPFVNPDLWAQTHDGWAYVGGHWSRDFFLERRVDGFPAFQFANEHLAPDAKVLLAPWETRGYYLERPTVWANPTGQRVIRWEQLKDATEAASTLRSLGITHIFWNDRFRIAGIENDAHRSSLLDSLLAEYGKAVYSHDGFAIYELQSAH